MDNLQVCASMISLNPICMQGPRIERRETLAGSAGNKGFDKKKFDDKIEGLELEDKIMALISGVLAAEESDVFSEKFD